METKCIFCDKPTSRFYSCRVCHSCGTIMNFTLNRDELFEEVRKCIISIQEYIDSISGTLYAIDGKCINGEELSSGEEKIRDFCSRFQSCRSELECMIAKHINQQDKLFRIDID